jgi:hypothetical protein
MRYTPSTPNVFATYRAAAGDAAVRSRVAAMTKRMPLSFYEKVGYPPNINPS